MFITIKKLIVPLVLLVALTAVSSKSEVPAGQSEVAAPSVANGAVIYKRTDNSSNVFFAGIGLATLPNKEITADTPDLRDIGYNDNIVFIRLTGEVHAAAVYSDINYQGDCESVTSHSSQVWSPSNTVGANISSIRLNYTCKGESKASPVLTDVTSVYGDSGNVRCPSGYTRRNQDLNAGAGGKYVYLCLQYGPMNARYVRGFSFGKGFSNDPACSGDGYHWTNDLKIGTKNSPLYMCVNTKPGNTNDPPIIDVDFVAQNSPFNPFSDYRPCESKLGLPPLQVKQGSDDLNKGLGGKYIYMCTGLSRPYER